MRARQLVSAIALALLTTAALAQSTGPIKGESSPGVYPNLITSTTAGLTNVLQVTTTGADPCAASDVLKKSVPFNITTAATTQLVALASGKVIYVCSFSMTISQPGTTANTLKFIEGTTSNCGAGTADLTGTFGAGGVTAGLPLPVTSGSSIGTEFSTNALGSRALCAVTTIGATAFFSGVVTYVQQ